MTLNTKHDSKEQYKTKIVTLNVIKIIINYYFLFIFNMFIIHFQSELMFIPQKNLTRVSLAYVNYLTLKHVVQMKHVCKQILQVSLEFVSVSMATS